MENEDWEKCLTCPMLLTEEYGTGSSKCVECMAEENEDRRGKENNDG